MIPTLQPYSLDEKARREGHRSALKWWGAFALFVLGVASLTALGVLAVWKFG